VNRGESARPALAGARSAYGRTMTTLLLRRSVDAPADVVWALLTDPEAMNTWSTARIELLDAGDRGRADGVGALRRVHLPGGRTRLTEVIHTAAAPHELGYTVVGGVAALREHTGRISLRADGEHTTEIRWEVVMRFAIPGMAAVIRPLIGRELAASLRRLVELAPTAPAPEPAAPAPRDLPPRDLAALRQTVAAVLAEQRDIADRLAGADDPKRWFARVYQYVTEEQLAHLDTGRVDNPEWVLRLIPRFHELYRRNLLAFERGAPTEEPWRKAWGLAERAGQTGSSAQMMKALLLGVAAHIESDLPRALRRTYAEDFADRVDYVYFRADYLRMADVFRIASDRLMADLPRTYTPVWLRLARAVLAPELRDQLMRRYYDIPRRRLAAFAAGGQPPQATADPPLAGADG